MSTLCPYCAQAELPRSIGSTLYTDVAARALSIARSVLELRSDPDIGLRQMAQGLIDPSTLPLATVHDRLCPYCRRGHVTRIAPVTVWVDAASRLVGLARQVNEIRHGKPGIPWFDLVWSVVDDGEPVVVATEVVNVEVTPEAEADHSYEADPDSSEEFEYGEPIDIEPEKFGSHEEW